MKSIIVLGMAALALPLAAAEPAAAPPFTLTLGARHAHVTPCRQGFTHTGGGNIDVAQPAPDTIVITMTGVAVAGGHPCKPSSASMKFELDQCIEIVCDKPDSRRARLTMEGRVIGLLRSHDKGGGTACEGPGQASVSSGSAVLAALDLPAHSVVGGQNLSINCRSGPVTCAVPPGAYELRQCWTVTASHPASFWPCKAASAELAPDPALDPLWISYWEPFHGAAKKDFGFQVIVRVAPE